eukprot:12273373-Ditylum_brightwellii.AAC.1
MKDSNKINYDQELRQLWQMQQQKAMEHQKFCPKYCCSTFPSKQQTCHSPFCLNTQSTYHARTT